ncbi:MAG: cation diffusion facilitator family transporter [Actinobacteria bacterium]|nr:cation diffusion facilitator family transporter [Actinomycetota bacterium]
MNRNSGLINSKASYMKKIAMFSILVSIFLVIIKVAVAYFTNSIGVFSEALNNGLDLVTVLVTYMAIRISTRPADKDHTYGHGKYENLSAFLEIVIISALSFFIIYKSIQRIIYKNFVLNLNWYVFLILIISIFLNIIRVFYIGRAARKYNSFAFKADFLNYSSDILSSIIVIIGLFMANAGIYVADPIASIIISVIILTFSLKLSIRIVGNLLDYIPKEVTDKVMEILKEIPEIKSVNKLKIHEVGNIKFINLEICLKNNLYLSQVENIKEKIKNKISSGVPYTEIILETKSLPTRDNIEAYVKEIILNQPYVKDIHNIYIYNVDNYIDISIHIELNKYLKLEETEKLTKVTEDKIKKKIGYIRSVYIHIEDARSGEDWNDITKESEKLISNIKKEISSHVNPETCHNFTILEKEGSYNLAFHCRLKKSLDVKKAHFIVTKIEDDIKKKFENISEISIHVEPRWQ